MTCMQVVTILRGIMYRGRGSAGGDTVLLYSRVQDMIYYSEHVDD